MPYLKSGSPFLYDDATGDVVGFRDGDGGESFPFAPRMTFAQMKALTGMVEGQAVCVTNYGRGGSLWRYSAALDDWFPTTPVLIYEKTSLTSGVAQTAAQILQAVPIEANLLKNKRFRVLATMAKSGGTDSLTASIRMGAAGTTADATVATTVVLSGSNRCVGTESWLRMASATSVERLGGGAATSWGANATTATANLPTTVGDVTAANYLSLACTMSGTTDTPQLGYVAVEILP